VALALLLVALLGTPEVARADWIISGDTIPADQVIDNDVILAGTNVRVDGTVNGDLVGGLIVWLLPSLLRRWVGRLRARPLPAIGYGLLASIIFFNGVGIAILLAAMLVAVGIWPGQITLWTLAFLFWGVGFSLLVLALSLLALAVFFVSKVIVSYLVARLILERVSPRAAQYRMLVLLLGLGFYTLLRSIPTIGWVIEVIVVVLGLGAIWLAFIDKEQPRRNDRGHGAPVDGPNRCRISAQPWERWSGP
jgi:Na+-transporting methylmalonyl-CoA/oxaloacetate decarboxylase gamma subunit